MRGVTLLYTRSLAQTWVVVFLAYLPSRAAYSSSERRILMSVEEGRNGRVLSYEINWLAFGGRHGDPQRDSANLLSDLLKVATDFLKIYFNIGGQVSVTM